MTATRVPDWLLERLAVGDLPKERAAQVRAQLELESDGARRLEQLRRSNKEILLQPPPRAVVPEIHRRAGRTRSTRPMLLLTLPALAAAAALGLAVRAPPTDSPAPGPTAG